MVQVSLPEILPGFICLTTNQNQLQVACVIDSFTSVAHLISQFSQLAVFQPTCPPSTHGQNRIHSSLQTIDLEEFSVEPSVSVRLDRQSDEFQQVVNDFDGDPSTIIQIDRIEKSLLSYSIHQL
jgi:hypothetical protein